MPARRLRIGLVLDDSLDTPAGVQQYVLTLGAWLQRHGHRVTYLASATARHDMANIRELTGNMGVAVNGNFIHTPFPVAARAVRHALDVGHFDILHVQMPFSPFMAGQVVRAADNATAVVGTFHVVPESRLGVLFSRLLAAWTRAAERRFDAVMSVSEPAQAFAQSAFRLPSTVVPIPIDLARFRDAKPLRTDDERLTILFLGRLVPRKGIRQLLLALAALSDMENVPDWRAVICGDGPLVHTLHQLASDHAMNDRITFTGRVAEADKPSYLASADITVFPSTGGESFGVVLLEAMAGGRSAVLAGNNSGYRSVLEACPGDVLFDPGDISGLANKLRSLLRDRRARQHIAEWQRHYTERFDIERVGRDIIKVYAGALRRRAD